MAITENRAATPDAVGPGTTDDSFGGSISGRLNWLRAGVLGANDGIVSTAAIVLGVAGATTDRWPILLAGIIALLAGAMSMAVGEYVSVSTQRDTERALIAKERRKLAADPAGELEELARIYSEKGIAADLSRQIAQQLTEHDALGAHAEAKLGIDPDELTQPWHAAIASFVSFVIGAAIPLAGILVTTNAWLTVVMVAIALGITGALSARLGRAPVAPAVLRNVGGGVLAMAITFGLGNLVGGLI